eukprot:4553053-Prymnesium_polylepis.1
MASGAVAKTSRRSAGTFVIAIDARSCTSPTVLASPSGSSQRVAVGRTQDIILLESRWPMMSPGGGIERYAAL